MKIVKINLSNMSRYKECTAAQARVESILDLIDILDTMDDEAISDEEYVKYVVSAEDTLTDLRNLLKARAKTYVGEGVL